MDIKYDQKTNTLTVRLKPVQIAESDEGGNLLGFEILDASLRIDDVTRVDFEVTL